MSQDRPNIYLVGFMGTGKTTVGRALAQRLDYTFLDSDHEIERSAGKPITEIFSTAGEPAFREMERRFIDSGHPDSGCVVACGGGLIVQPGMVEAVSKRGVLICLHASIETILRRIAGLKHRPLINVDDQETRVRTLFAQREPAYRRAGSMVLTDGRPLPDIVAHIVRIYRREVPDLARRPAPKV